MRLSLYQDSRDSLGTSLSRDVCPFFYYRQFDTKQDPLSGIIKKGQKLRERYAFRIPGESQFARKFYIIGYYDIMRRKNIRLYNLRFNRLLGNHYENI